MKDVAAWRERMGIDVRVERRSFFRQLGSSVLRFTEHAPMDAHVDAGFECNCTRNVDVRPAGRPHEVQQDVTLHCPMRAQRVRAEFELTRGWLKFWFEESAPYVEGGAYRGRSDPRVAEMKKIFTESGSKQSNHAYFIFDGPRVPRGRPQTSDNQHIRVEMSLPGYGLTDCFFADVFVGRDVDVSKLMNGHAPSRIVNLAKISGQDVWLHGCNWGHEAMRVMHDDVERPSREAATWRKAISEARWIQKLVARHEVDSSPVEEVLGRVLEDAVLLEAAFHQVERLAQVTAGLRSTCLYALQDDIDREIEQAIAAERARDEGLA